MPPSVGSPAVAGLAGISAGGADAEQMFRALTGAQEAERRALGDAVLDGHYIEVKQANSPTLNQVRAVKYITLVAYYVPDQAWFVVPANEVVRQCSLKTRGQHTENPFESATLSLKNLTAYAVDDEDNLRERVVAAIAEAEKYADLGEHMANVLAQSGDLAARSIANVREALERHDLR